MMPRTQRNGFTINEVVMYVAVFLKHLRLVALLCCLATLLGLCYYNFSRPIYYSNTTVNYQTIERPTQTLDADKVFRDSSDRLVREAISSQHILDRAARRLGFSGPSTDLYKKHIRKLTVRFNAQRNIEIELWTFSRQWTEELPRLLIQEYLLFREERRRERMELLVNSFNKEAAEMREKMNERFNAKFDFRDSNDVTKVLIELQQLQQVPKDLLVIKHQLMMMDDAKHTLETGNLDTIGKLALIASLDKKSSLSIGQVIPNIMPNGDFAATEEKKDVTAPVVVVPSMVVSSRPWEDLDKERRRLIDQQQQVGQVYLSGHPKMKELQRQIDGYTQALELELQVALNRFNLEYSNLVEKKRNFEAKLDDYNEITRKHQKYLQDYAQFDIGHLAWEKMYAALERQLSAVDYGADKERSFLQFERTTVQEKPASPSVLRLIAYTMMLAFALSLAVPFLIEYLDNRVSDVDEVEQTLRIRGLGVVPKVEEPDNESMFMLGDTKPDYHLQENFRVIRTNLILNSETAALPQVILVTSAMPQEGKTVVSSNLAMSFAMKGEKTLLVDGDLRRGRLHRLFGAHNKPGLSDVLREKRPIEEAYRPTGHENLTIMTCGKHLNSASELLDSASFGRLIEELRQRYQRIIIDTPPVLGLAETSIIQRHSDGILFVIWSDHTPIRNVKAAIQSLQTNGAKFCGFVLNRLDFHTLGNRYKYFYYAPNYYTNYKAIETPAVAES